MHAAGTPRWQQLTALVSLSAGGAITGFSFVPGPAADLASPSGMPIHLMALQQSVKPAPANDAMLRSAIVNVAEYYLRMARDRTPAEMEAIIWQNDSINGVDHGQSCAAFASLTLELAAQVVGQRSWVTGGTSYPWPIHKWADVRVDPNPASPGVTSILQDAKAHQRWHPLGDGYQPQPGDWALFHGHVEVIKSYAHGVLHTIGGDSLPDFSVNAHKFSAPLGDQGIVGFVNNGERAGPAGNAQAQAHREHASRHHRARAQTPVTLAAIPGAATAGSAQRAPARHGSAAIPSMPAPVPSPGKDAQADRQGREHPPPGRHAPDHTSRGKAAGAGAERVASKVPGSSPATRGSAARGSAARGAAAIPGLSRPAHRRHAGSAAAHRGSAGPPASSRAVHRGPRPAPVPAPAAPQDITTQEAFIRAVAPGAVAAQRKYGVPAAVTIAQAIDESGWGQSELAVTDHNLFGIKGTGPAGSASLPTQEYENGSAVSRTAAFRRYNSVAESIDDHGKLLATSGYYTRAMAERQNPNAFAAALTGVYATDPNYGTKLVGLMRRYDLYRYDLSGTAVAHHPASAGGNPHSHIPAADAGHADGHASAGNANGYTPGDDADRDTAAIIARGYAAGGSDTDSPGISDAGSPGINADRDNSANRGAPASAGHCARGIRRPGPDAGSPNCGRRSPGNGPRHGCAGDTAPAGQARRRAARGGAGRRHHPWPAKSHAAAGPASRCAPVRFQRHAINSDSVRSAGVYAGQPPAAADRLSQIPRHSDSVSAKHPPARTERLYLHGQSAAHARGAALPRCCQPQRHPLGVAGCLRLDAVQGSATLLTGPWREARHAQPVRHDLPDEIGGTGTVRR